MAQRRKQRKEQNAMDRQGAWNKREQFLHYVKHGGEKFCSPQIGAGAGFDTKCAGKEWIGETTLEDTLETVGRFDMVPLINVGCPFEGCVQDLSWKERVTESTDWRITREYTLDTPVGTLRRVVCEEKMSGLCMLKYAVTCEEELDVFRYYADALLEADFSPVARYTREAVDKIAGRAALSVQWPVQPYELLCFPSTVDTVFLAGDCPEKFGKLMDKIVAIDEKLMKAVKEGGGDFIFLGGPGSELLSPSYYENYIIPYSQVVTSMAHNLGLLVYSHICSPIEPFLTMGFYNRMGIDLFETLSAPPVGNIKSLKDALDKLDPKICTRGNVGLDILLNQSPQEVREEVYRILEASEGRKHIVAASDYLFYQVPEKNVQAMCQAGREL